VIEHQPGHQRRKQIIGKGNLEHRLVVGSDLDVMPSPEPYQKALADPSAQLLC
jgi:hypothetical protein